MKYYYVIFSLIRMVKCNPEFLMVEGKEAFINDFPHSALLRVVCLERGDTQWTCGASILNQRIILTAAHCVDDCSSRDTLSVSVGHSHTKKGTQSSVLSIYRYKNFTRKTGLHDIALLQLKTDLKLNHKVQRVAFMKYPPYFEKAKVAGWGVNTDSWPKVTSEDLYYISQYVWTARKCKEVIVELTGGRFCASSRKNTSYCNGGDSGSALVVRGYIQIGLVSYKIPNLSRSLVVYTDTGYYYDWIKKNAKKLYCVNQVDFNQ